MKILLRAGRGAADGRAEEATNERLCLAKMSNKFFPVYSDLRNTLVTNTLKKAPLFKQ